jgi:hypothetical protein
MEAFGVSVRGQLGPLSKGLHPEMDFVGVAEIPINIEPEINAFHCPEFTPR